MKVAASTKGKSAARPAAANGIVEVSDEESDEDGCKPLGMSHGSGKARCPARHLIEHQAAFANEFGCAITHTCIKTWLCPYSHTALTSPAWSRCIM